MFESFLFHDQNVFGNLTCSFCSTRNVMPLAITNTLITHAEPRRRFSLKALLQTLRKTQPRVVTCSTPLQVDQPRSFLLIKKVRIF